MKTCRDILVSLSTIVLVASAAPLSAEVTSRGAVELARVLKEKPETDKDKDGILNFDEYDAFFRTQGDKKPANPLSMELVGGDLLISDFEQNNVGKMAQWGWKIEGEAFRGNLDAGTRLMKRRAGSFSGRYFLSSYGKSDSVTGRLLSPEFEIAKPLIRFLLSGGGFERSTCVNLTVGGEVVRSATGRNDDRFEKVALDVAEFVGQRAQIEVVDDYRGLWGHINVDQMTQSDDAGSARVIGGPPGPVPGRPGRVRCADGNSPDGTAVIRDGKLDIAGQLVSYGDVLLAVCDADSPPKNATDKSMRLVSGEIWKVRKIALDEGKLSVHSDLFGAREIAIDQVASLEFQSAPAEGPSPERGHLYRTNGEPIPGKLIWIREKDVAIDCALGIVPVPLASVRSFVFAEAKAGRVLADEIQLADGSLIFGTVSFEGDQLLVDHAAFGQIKLPWAALRHLRRADERVAWLDQAESKVVESRGPASPPPAPQVLESTDANHLRSIRMMPRTVVSYQVPMSTAENNRLFLAELQPIAACRADVLVRVSVGGSVLWERTVRAADKVRRVWIEMPNSAAATSAGELTIEVDFAGQLAFPCGIEWRDPRVKTIIAGEIPKPPDSD